MQLWNWWQRTLSYSSSSREMAHLLTPAPTYLHHHDGPPQPAELLNQSLVISPPRPQHLHTCNEFLKKWKKMKKNLKRTAYICCNYRIYHIFCLRNHKWIFWFANSFCYYELHYSKATADGWKYLRFRWGINPRGKTWRPPPKTS